MYVDTAQFPSEPADSAGVCLTVRDSRVLQSQTEVSGLQSILAHHRSIAVTWVLLRQIIAALLMDVNSRKPKVLTAPHNRGLHGNRDVDLAGQLDRLHAVEHLHTQSMLGN